MLKVRRSWDRLIFNMGIPILVTRHRYIEAAPRKCLSVLTTTHLSRRIWDNVFEDCFRSAIMVMLHGGVTWGPKRNSELQRLCRNDRTLIRWICGTRDETPSAALLQKIRIEDIPAVGDSIGMAIYSGRRPVSILSQTFRFPALESKESLARHGLDVWRLVSVIVAWLALTRKAEMHGQSVFDMAWCNQPRRMGHRQHLNLKWIWMVELLKRVYSPVGLK